MRNELSYVLITPYTIMKSRTGGVIARLLSRATKLELVAAQMLAPTAEFSKRYADLLEMSVGRRDENAAKLLSDYVRNRFSPSTDGKRQRIMMLVFKGRDACRELYEIVGRITPEPMDSEKVTGETIRDTYADLMRDVNGNIKYFEPAVLSPPTCRDAAEKLRVFADFAGGQPNLVSNIVRESNKGERTLVIIKPDNWRQASVKPGNIIDMFSRTGLRIIGCKIHRMSVADALQFYGPVRDVLRKKLAPVVGKRAREVLQESLEFALRGGVERELTRIVGRDYADDQFNQIIEFMSGTRPNKCSKAALTKPGKVKCMILIYEGKGAVKKIRNVLGPTDPTKAPGGTIRAEFGRDVMVNTAHASDSTPNARREMEVVNVEHNNLAEILNEHLNE